MILPWEVKIVLVENYHFKEYCALLFSFFLESFQFLFTMYLFPPTWESLGYAYQNFSQKFYHILVCKLLQYQKMTKVRFKSPKEGKNNDYENNQT